MDRKTGFGAIWFLALLVFHNGSPAQAVDGISASYSRAEQLIDSYRVAFQLEMPTIWQSEDGWELVWFWEASAAYWQSDIRRNYAPQFSTGNANIVVLAVSPVFRYRRQAPLDGSSWPYYEAGVGIAYLDEDRIQKKSFEDREFGSLWLFEDQIGFGALFGSEHQWDLSVRWMHYSNANLVTPNEGLSLVSLTAGYWF